MNFEQLAQLITWTCYVIILCGLGVIVPFTIRLIYLTIKRIKRIVKPKFQMSAYDWNRLHERLDENEDKLNDVSNLLEKLLLAQVEEANKEYLKSIRKPRRKK